jgi:hypothetical protein
MVDGRSTVSTLAMNSRPCPHCLPHTGSDRGAGDAQHAEPWNRLGAVAAGLRTAVPPVKWTTAHEQAMGTERNGNGGVRAGRGQQHTG